MTREAIREADVSWLDLWEQLRPAVLATAGMMVAMLGASSIMSALDQEHGLPRLAGFVAVGALAYVAALLTARGPVIREFGEIAGWLYRRSRPLDMSE